VARYKIAFIVNYFPSLSETFILNQITDLIEKGHSVEIYSFNRGKSDFTHGSVSQYRLLEHTTYFEGPSSSLTAKLNLVGHYIVNGALESVKKVGSKLFNIKTFKKQLYTYSISLSLEKFLKRMSPDIVHAHFGQRGTVVADVMKRMNNPGFKLVVTFHGYDLNPLYLHRYKKEYRTLFRFADAITVNTKYLAEVLLSVYDKPRNLTILPAGLKTDQYQKTSGRTQTLYDFTMVFCGRLIELKGPHLAIEIVNCLVKRGRKNVRLRIIGNGEMKEKLEVQVDKLSLREHVQLLGSMKQEEVINELNNADLFLLPGTHDKQTGRVEAQGLVIQEAQAMELPVVVSDAGGMKYGLMDGVTGYVVKTGDIEAFADKIELLMKDDVLRANMGRKGREWVKANFDTRILGDKLLDLYSKL
jgi:colanic acid/amylovoran biosynthesis glycosyltransferase